MSELFTGDSVAAASAPSAADTTEVSAPASSPSPAAAGVSPAVETATTPQAAPDGSVVPAQTTTTTDPTPKGPIPFEAHKTALENARTKAAQETEAKYTWAASIPEPHRHTVSEFYTLLDREPTQAVEVLMSTIANDPQHAPKLRSLLGRLLGNRSADRPAAPLGAMPEPDFQDDQGHTFYSAGRIKELADAIEARIDAKYAKELNPLKTDLQTRAQRAAQEQAQHDADQWAATRYAKVSQWPNFKAHEPAIAQAMAADSDLEIGDAYIQVVVPQLSQQERQSVVARLHDKANASSVNPANPASAVQAPPKDFREAFAQLPESAFS